MAQGQKLLDPSNSMYQPYQYQPPAKTYTLPDGEQTTSVDTYKNEWQNASKTGDIKSGLSVPSDIGVSSVTVPGVGQVSNNQYSSQFNPTIIPNQPQSNQTNQTSPTPNYSAPQPTDPGTKYKNALAAAPKGQVPQNTPEGRSGAQDLVNSVNPAPRPSDPVSMAIDTTSAQLLSDIQQKNNAEATMQSVGSYSASLSSSLGIPAMKTELMNIDNVMNGTDQDVRNEITAAGGFATESQVEAIVASRNKTLLLKASNIQNALANAQDTLSTQVGAYQADRSNYMNALNDRINGDQTALSLFQNIQNKASANYQRIFTAEGWNGLAQLDPNSQNLIEKTWGLPSGALSDPDWVQQQQDLLYKQQSIGQRNISIDLSQSRLGLAQQGLDLRTQSTDAMLLSRYNTAINNTLKQLYPSNKNPIQLYNNSAQAINRVDQSLSESTNPNNPDKAASDLDLVDAYVQIARGGQNINEAQVDTLLKGLGIKASWDVTKQKITGTGILDNGTRQSIGKLSHKIFDGQKKLADQSVTDINSRLTQQKIPSQYLFQNPEEISFGVTAKDQDGNEQTYQTGQVIPVANGSLTVQSDGTLLGSDGNKYDQDGNIIK